MLKSMICGAVLGASFMVAGVAEAAIYIKIEGVDGESTRGGTGGWIALDTLEQDMRTESSQSGGARARTSVDVGEIVVTKAFDRTSVPLRDNLVKGRVFPKAEIVVTGMPGRAGQGGAGYSILLEGARITGVSYSVGENGLGSEHVSFAYQKITWKSGTYDAKTGAIKPGQSASYDLKRGQ